MKQTASALQRPAAGKQQPYVIIYPLKRKDKVIPTALSVTPTAKPLGHWGNQDFWNSNDEYRQYIRTLTEFHDQVKKLATWIVSADSTSSNADLPTHCQEVDSLLRKIYQIQDSPQGLTSYELSRPISFDQRLQDCHKELLEIFKALLDHHQENELESLTPSKVAKIRESAKARQFHEYQIKTQALAIGVTRIVGGQRQGLIEVIVKADSLKLAEILTKQTYTATEACWRGQGKLLQKFFYIDSLKNAIAHMFRVIVKTRHGDSIKTQEAWLQAFSVTGSKYRVFIAGPNLAEGPTIPIPALTETLLGYIDDLMYQAHSELAALIEAGKTDDRILYRDSQAKHSVRSHPSQSDKERTMDVDDKSSIAMEAVNTKKAKTKNLSKLAVQSSPQPDDPSQPRSTPRKKKRDAVEGPREDTSLAPETQSIDGGIGIDGRVDDGAVFDNYGGDSLFGDPRTQDEDGNEV